MAVLTPAVLPSNAVRDAKSILRHPGIAVQYLSLYQNSGQIAAIRYLRLQAQVRKMTALVQEINIILLIDTENRLKRLLEIESRIDKQVDEAIAFATGKQINELSPEATKFAAQKKLARLLPKESAVNSLIKKLQEKIKQLQPG